jgi:SIR2-like domain
MSTAPNELKQQIAKRQAVFFVGAGVSARATNNPVATWTGLLEDGVRFCEKHIDGLRPGWADRVRADIRSADPDDMLVAAEKITRKLASSVNLQAWLRASIGNFQPITRDVLEAIAALNLPIMTTNYDRLLEEVTGQLPVSWREDDRVRRVLFENEPGIVHVHGWFEIPDSIVLDVRSYERIISSEYMSSVLKSIALAKSIIFVGFGSGLADPNFSRLRLWIRDVLVNVTNRHYRLCLTGELEQLRNDHQADAFLRVLPFGADQDELAAYLRSLAPETPGLGGAFQSAQTSPPVAAIADPQAARVEPQATTSVTPAEERTRPLSTVPVSQVLQGIAQSSSDESSTALLQALERYAPALIEAVRQTQQAS